MNREPARRVSETWGNPIRRDVSTCAIPDALEALEKSEGGKRDVPC
jgi:hypothetical protein